MNHRILICTDLDRTLLPNGEPPESPGARARFAALTARSEVTLVYATGRHRALVEEAIADYQLPAPELLIGDVGTAIYECSGENWRRWPEWDREITLDWNGITVQELSELFQDLAGLKPQEREKQGRFKLSYYVALTTDHEQLLDLMRQRLQARRINAGLIWSVDESTGIGLLDVLPAGAGKLHALEFLMRRLGFHPENSVFAGDSGNDLAVLTSNIQSVLVANASPEVSREARRRVERSECSDSLYLAKGGFLGMNGNYSAGILEGVCHFLPFTRDWMSPENSHA